MKRMRLLGGPLDSTVHLRATGNHGAFSVVFLAVTAMLSVSPLPVPAQGAPTRLACAAAVCEDEVLIILAIEAALDSTDFCRVGPARILATLHPAPYTAFADGVRGRPPRRGVPSSPATLRLEDVGILSARRFRHSVVIVDSSDVLKGTEKPVGCLVVASPPSAREAGEMRVLVALHSAATDEGVQRLVFLGRERGEWVVVRHVVGYRS